MTLRSPSISAPRIAELKDFWIAVKDPSTRAAIAKRMQVDASNLDVRAGFDTIRQILPPRRDWKTQAGQDFEVSLKRYDTLVSSSARLALGKGRRGAPTESQRHLSQASLVLGIGSFDAYVRQFTIDGYSTLFFGSGTSKQPSQRVREKFHQAIKKVVQGNPDLVLELAREQPMIAKTHLAADVFDIEQIRLLTSSFADVQTALDSLGIDLKATATPVERQFLDLAGPIFDAYCAARHVAMHAGVGATRGTSTRGRVATLYCANDQPARFLGDFLRAFAYLIEGRVHW
jgi:hypothetical protein